MAKELKGYTHDCIISFLDLYEKVKRNAPNIKPPTKDEQIEMAKAFSKIGKENDMVIHSCCEKTYLAEYGLDISGCMSKEIVENAIGYSLKPPMEIWKNENIKAHKFISKEYWESNYNYVKEVLPNAEIYVYILDGRIVGFIGLNNNYIEGIFIDSNSQGKGIGTDLLNKVKEQKESLVLSVYKKNTNAINFYKKNNFSIKSENIDKNTNEIEYTMVWSK